MTVSDNSLMPITDCPIKNVTLQGVRRVLYPAVFPG